MKNISLNLPTSILFPIFIVGLSLLTGWPSGEARASDPEPVGSEFELASSTLEEEAPSVAYIGSGVFVVLWHADPLSGADHEVSGQRFDSGGNLLGGKFAVNAATTGPQKFPDVVSDGSDGFMVVWQSNDSGHYDIRARHFASDGSPNASEFTVNSLTTDQQAYPQITRDLSMSGRFLVAWQGDASGSYAIHGRIIDPLGTLGSEFVAHALDTGIRMRPAVTGLSNGDFVVAWQEYGTMKADDFDIRARLVDSTGSLLGSELAVNTTVTGYQAMPSVANKLGGKSADDFAVVWQSDSGKTHQTIAIQGFSSDGTPKGSETLVSTGTLTGPQSQPVIRIDSKDEFIIAWRDDADPARRSPRSSFGIPQVIHSQSSAGPPFSFFAFDQDHLGSTAGPLLTLNTETTEVSLPDLAADDSGRYVGVWQSLDIGGSAGIRGRTVEAPPGALSFTAATFDVAENGSAASITVERTSGDCGAVSVRCDTADGTARAGDDYTTTMQTLSWVDGETGTKICTVPITDDMDSESDETILMSLTNVTGATLGTPNTAILTLFDDDPLCGGPECIFGDGFESGDTSQWSSTDG